MSDHFLDHDSTLDQAQQSHAWTGYHPEPMEFGCPCFECGWHAFARSLGAGTPEAQAALREYIRTGLEAHRLNEAFYRAYDAGAGQDDAMRLSITGVERHERARDAFAALATPTEEGQG